MPGTVFVIIDTISTVDRAFNDVRTLSNADPYAIKVPNSAVKKATQREFRYTPVKSLD